MVCADGYDIIALPPDPTSRTDLGHLRPSIGVHFNDYLAGTIDYLDGKDFATACLTLKAWIPLTGLL